MRLLNLFQSASSRYGRLLRLSSVVAALLLVSLALSACGKNFYFAGRNLPPSGILNRVLIAVQNSGTGQLLLVDGLYDVRHNYNNTVGGFPISGFTPRALPVSIQNLPGEQTGLIYSSSDGTLSPVSYATETAGPTILPSVGTNAIASSAFASTSRQYIVAAQQQLHSLEVFDASATPNTFLLNLPGVYRVSINQGGTIALAFVQNQNTVYSVVHLTTAQQQLAATLPPPQGGSHFPINGRAAEDCEPQNLPQYCVYPVDTTAAPVDHPIKAVFSPDGASAYVIDCGPECGGQAAGVTQILLNGSALNSGTNGPSGAGLNTSKFIAVPGGATNAIFNNATMYVAGQQQLPDGLFTGELSVVNTGTGTVGAPIPISDGTHNRMLFADDNTLWIGSSDCQGGERYKQAQAGAATPYGCMTMFNMAANTVTAIESYKGDGTGIAALTALHKVYTAEGGQVYIYRTTNGAALDNVNVTVQGTVVDVAYMDAPDDSNNSWY